MVKRKMHTKNRAG